MDYIKQLFFDFFDKMNLLEGVSHFLSSILIVILWIIIGLIAIRIFRAFIYKGFKIRQKGPRALTIGKLMSSVVKYIIYFIIAILILVELKVDVTPIVASAGVFGLAIGFGAQEVIKDFVSGFFIIFEESFNEGDLVQVGGFTGKVIDLGIRVTKIQNWRNEVLIIRNGSMGSVINYSKADSIAVVDFGVSYKTDLDKFRVVVVEFMESIHGKINNIIEKPSYLGIIELAPSSINMRIIAKTVTLEHFQVERDIRSELILFCEANKIEIPFPQVVVHNE